MEISRFRKQHSEGIDKNAWATWLSDDVVPVSKSPALQPTHQSTAMPIKVPINAPRSRASEPMVAIKRPIAAPVTASPAATAPKVTTQPKSPSQPAASKANRRSSYTSRRPANSGRPNAYYAMGGSPADVAYGRTRPTGGGAAPRKSNISISIRMPKLHLPKLRKIHVSEAARPWVIAGTVVVLLLFAGSAFSLWQRRHKPNTPVETISATKDMGYKPFIPEGKTVEKAGQYDAERKMYTFYDTYEGINITVNQQTLPERLKGSRSEQQKLADSIFATETFETAKGTAYMATSEGSGAQRVVVVGDHMLLFLQSTQRLDSHGWILYLQKLQ